MEKCNTQKPVAPHAKVKSVGTHVSKKRKVVALAKPLKIK
jgi:hypothetical protein